MAKMAFLVTISLFVLCSLILAFRAADVSSEEEKFHSPFSQDTDLPHTVFTKEELSRYDGSDVSRTRMNFFSSSFCRSFHPMQYCFSPCADLFGKVLLVG